MSSEGIILLTPSVRVTILCDSTCWYRKVAVVRAGVGSLQLFKQVRRQSFNIEH